MPNPRALGRRLSCLMVGLVDGSPISNMLEQAGFEVTHSLSEPTTMKTLQGQAFDVVFAADSLDSRALQSLMAHAAHEQPPAPVVVVAGTAAGNGAAEHPAQPDEAVGNDSLTIPASATLAEVERTVIVEHLRRARTKAEAARSLGMGLRTLYTKIGKLQLADISRGRLGRRNGST